MTGRGNYIYIGGGFVTLVVIVLVVLLLLPAADSWITSVTYQWDRRKANAQADN